MTDTRAVIGDHALGEKIRDAAGRFFLLRETDVTFEQVVTLCINGGLPTALVLYFVWDNRGREDERTRRLNALEAFQTEVLLNLVKDSTALLEKSNELHAQSNQILSESTRTIEVALRLLEGGEK